MRGRAARFAVVDVGSNTIHLLVADCDGQRLTRLNRESVRLRLGADVARSGFIDPEKVNAAVQVVRLFVGRATRFESDSVTLIGTQAVRAAQNGVHLAREVQRATGLPLQVIDPRAEARLAYLGTTLDYPGERPRLIVDVGGGSTQLLTVDEQGQCHSTHSVPVGSLNLPMRYLLHDPPTARELGRLERAVLCALQDAQHALRGGGMRPEYAVATGGVARRLRRAGRLAAGEPLTLAWLERFVPVAFSVNAEALDVVGAVRTVDADMVRAGAVVLRDVLQGCGIRYCGVSDHGIREGAVPCLARGQHIAGAA